MCDTDYLSVRVTTPTGKQHVYFGDDGDMDYAIDDDGVLLIGYEDELTISDDLISGFTISYARGAWDIAEQNYA